VRGTVLPNNDAPRIEVLNHNAVMETSAEQAFDDLALLAAQLCQTPVAVIVLVDGSRHVIKAKVGLLASELAAAVTFCEPTRSGTELVQVPDILAVKEFASHPLVVSEPGIRFYAAAPLITAAGVTVGTLCVIDYAPRYLTAEQQSALKTLARQVVAQLSHISARGHLEEALERTNKELEAKVAERTAELSIINEQLVSGAHERKMLEEKLLLREQLLHAFFAVAPAGLAISDDQFRYVHISETLAQMNGLTVKDHLGKRIGEILPHIAPVMNPMFEHIMASGQPVLDLEMSDDDFGGIPAGTQTHVRHWNFSCFPIKGDEGKPIGIGTFGIDITRRLKAEEALRESVEQFRGTFEQAAVGIAHIDPKGRWLRVNNKLCDILGRTPEELCETTFQEITHPDDLDSDLEYIRRMLNNELDTYSIEKRSIRKDGSSVWLNLTVSLVREANGKPKYFISVVEDITDRKQMMETLHEREEQLRQSQKMEAVGQLAGGIAHDFNNLLTAIAGNCMFLLQDLEHANPLREEVEEIRKSADRAATLTRQLLAFSRKQMLQPKVLDLNVVVADISKMVQRLIGSHIKIEVNLEPGEKFVEVDPGQIEQVLLNLAVNARDAMPQGGQLSIESSHVTLDTINQFKDISVPPGDYVKLCVTDTGCGIEPDILAHIFEPFFTTKDIGKGTGLGLSTVHGIIKQSGGDIRVSSEPGCGTIFDIYLPQVSESAEEEQSVEKELSQPVEAGTVLLVEDEEVVRRIASHVLKQQGYQLLEAANGQEALELAISNHGKFDLLLTDLRMPEMSGQEIAQFLTSLYPHVKVVFMTGAIEDDIFNQDDGATSPICLQKPWTPDTLSLAVRQALDGVAV
jgi:PAS domain S-box-containing protein